MQKYNYLDLAEEYLRNSKRQHFVLLLTATLLGFYAFTNLFFQFLIESIHLEDITIANTLIINRKNTLIELISVVIIAPIVETFLFQQLSYEILNRIKLFHGNSNRIITISGLIFGLSHLYSLYYIIYTFVIGMVFMYFYISRIKHDTKTFLLICTSHSIFNLLIYIIHQFGQYQG